MLHLSILSLSLSLALPLSLSLHPFPPFKSHPCWSVSSHTSPSQPDIALSGLSLSPSSLFLFLYLSWHKWMSGAAEEPLAKNEFAGELRFSVCGEDSPLPPRLLQRLAVRHQQAHRHQTSRQERVWPELFVGGHLREGTYFFWISPTCSLFSSLLKINKWAVSFCFCSTSNPCFLVKSWDGVNVDVVRHRRGKICGNVTSVGVKSRLDLTPSVSPVHVCGCTCL